MRFGNVAHSFAAGTAMMISAECLAKKLDGPSKKPTAQLMSVQTAKAEKEKAERAQEAKEVRTALAYLYARIPKTFGGEEVPAARHEDVRLMIRTLVEWNMGTIRQPNWTGQWRNDVLPVVFKNRILRWERVHKALEAAWVPRKTPRHNFLFAQLTQESLLSPTIRSSTGALWTAQFIKATAMNRALVGRILVLEGGGIDYRCDIEKAVAAMVYHMDVIDDPFAWSLSWAKTAYSRWEAGAGSIYKLTRDANGIPIWNAWMVPTAIFQEAGRLYKSRWDTWAYQAQQYPATTLAMHIILTYASKAFPEYFYAPKVHPLERLDEVNPSSPKWHQVTLPTKTNLHKWSRRNGVQFSQVKKWNPFLRADRIATRDVSVWVRTDLWQKQSTAESTPRQKSRRVRKKVQAVVANVEDSSVPTPAPVSKN